MRSRRGNRHRVFVCFIRLVLAGRPVGDAETHSNSNTRLQINSGNSCQLIWRDSYVYDYTIFFLLMRPWCLKTSRKKRWSTHIQTIQCQQWSSKGTLTAGKEPKRDDLAVTCTHSLFDTLVTETNFRRTQSPPHGMWADARPAMAVTFFSLFLILLLVVVRYCCPVVIVIHKSIELALEKRHTARHGWETPFDD